MSKSCQEANVSTVQMSKNRKKRPSNTVEIIDIDTFDVHGEDENVVHDTAEVVDIHGTRSRLMGVSYSSQMVAMTHEKSSSAQSNTHIEASTPEYTFLEADVFYDGPSESVMDDDSEVQVKGKTSKQRVRLPA